jgi:hypothetical protein
VVPARSGTTHRPWTLSTSGGQFLTIKKGSEFPALSLFYL